MKTEREIHEILVEVTDRYDRKTKFSGYNGVFCGGYRMALEDVLEIQRPRAIPAKTNYMENDDFTGKLQLLRQKLVEAGIHQKKTISVFTLDKIFQDVFLEGRKW